MTEADVPIKLWRPRDVAVIGILLGFPAGIGVAARNSWRLGRRRRAVALLAAGAIGFLALVLIPDVPAAAAGSVSIAVAVLLFLMAREDHDQLEASGRPVERAGALAGLATILGSWVLLAAPALVISAPALLSAEPGSPVRGTVAFGTSGSACEIGGVATSFNVDDPLHVVASLSRPVSAGEVVQTSIRHVDSGISDTAERTADTDWHCIFVDLPANALEPGAYVIEYSVGAERLARGEVRISP